VNYRPAGSFLVEEMPRTQRFPERKSSYPMRPSGWADAKQSSSTGWMEIDRTIEPPARDGLAMLWSGSNGPSPDALWMRTTTPDGKGDLVKIGISEVCRSRQ